MSLASRRAANVAGILFVALFVVGGLFSMDQPDVSDLGSAAADQKLLTYLSSSSNRVEHIVGVYLLIVGAIAFAWFCLGLRARVDAATAGNPTPGRLITMLATVGAALMIAAGMTGAVVAGDVSAGGDPLPANGGAARVVMSLTFPLLFIAFALVAAALIATVSVVAMRAGVLPRWLGIVGWLAVLGCIGGVIFLPMVLPLLWFLAVAIVGLTRPGVPAAAG